MNAVDATEHFNQSSGPGRPSLLALIIDTNPPAWASLTSTLPLQTALSNLLLFLNAHLALSHTNKAVIIASHTHVSRILYPPPANSPALTKKPTLNAGDLANKYRQFKEVEDCVTEELSRLLNETSEKSLEGVDASRTCISGALTMALAYINKVNAQRVDATATGGILKGDKGVGAGTGIDEEQVGVSSRICVVSVSGDLSSQYVPIMKCIFAAQRRKIPIDVCKIAGDTVFLQQAADATGGIYMQLEEPRGLLQYLMMAFLPDLSSRQHLVLPTQANVDFRAACFCHKKVVDVGYVCSICLAIFCEQPPGLICTICGSKLAAQPGGVVVARKKKKKKRPDGTTVSEAGTPTPL